MLVGSQYCWGWIRENWILSLTWSSQPCGDAVQPGKLTGLVGGVTGGRYGRSACLLVVLFFKRLLL